MKSKVAVVEIEKDARQALEKAFSLIGVDDLITETKSVAVKVGIFDHKHGHHHTTVDVVSGLVNTFDKAPTVYLAESDNYKGKALERIQVYKDIFSQVVPFNLSEDTETREVMVAGEKMQFSHILFKPTVLVSTHVLRKAEIGSVIKNLLGLVPDRKKARFHKKLVPTLLDIYEAVGGIDLAVLDGTYAYCDPTNAEDEGIKANILVVGRDAVAVETVGVFLAGLNPEEIPLLQEAMKRGLGEGNLENIEVLGSSLDILIERILE